MRSMVEGHASCLLPFRRHETPPVPLHHLRWSPSPCRGGSAASGRLRSFPLQFANGPERTAALSLGARAAPKGWQGTDSLAMRSKDRKSTRLPVTNAQLVCRLLLEKKNKNNT